MASINPNWRYLSSAELKRNPAFSAFLEVFDEDNEDLWANISPRSRNALIEKYHAALRFWMNMDPLKLQHLDFSLDIYDCDRIENSLVHQIVDERLKNLSKFCASMYLYILRSMSQRNADIALEVISRLRSQRSHF